MRIKILDSKCIMFNIKSKLDRLSLFLSVKPLNDLRVTQQSRLTVIHQLRFLFCTKRQFMDYFMHTMDWQLPRACRTCPSTDVARVKYLGIY